MSAVTTNQPLGTPTWIDLGIPDLDRAMAFYGSVFGWEFDVGPEEYGRYTMCLLGGKKVAALMPNPDENATEFWWNVYLATDDLDATVARSAAAGGTLLMEPMDIADQGRMAMVRDPAGAQFGLWQGRAHVGCELVNEPNTLLRNDLVTPNPGPAREFYAAVFDFTLDGNADLPGMDFTFLRRPDGHEIGGIVGDAAARSLPGHGSSRWPIPTRPSPRPGPTGVPRTTRRTWCTGGPRMSPIRSGRSSRWVLRCRVGRGRGVSGRK